MPTLELTKEEVVILRAALNHAVQHLAETKEDLYVLYDTNMSLGDLFFTINDLRGKVREAAAEK